MKIFKAYLGVIKKFVKIVENDYEKDRCHLEIENRENNKKKMKLIRLDLLVKVLMELKKETWFEFL